MSVTPPIQIGGCGRCRGVGRTITSPVGELLPAVAERIAAPGLDQNLQLLVEPPAAGSEIDSEVLELHLAVTRRDAEREAAVAEQIDHGGVLGHAQRIVEGKDHHPGGRSC